MKLTVNTTQLQAMLSKAIRGAGNDKLVPMTSLIAISLKDGKLTLMTNDASNYLYLTADDVEGDEFYVAVNVEILSKLVSKMTSEKISLEVTDSKLKVTGNGTYEIALDVEDDGTLSKLPDPLSGLACEVVGSVDSSVIANILASIKSALLTTADYPWYTCYHVSDSVVASDTFTVASYKGGFLKTPTLISSETMDLVGLLVGKINIRMGDGKIVFENETGAVYSPIPDNIDKYDIKALNEYLEQDFDYSCKLTKSTMLNLLDRISLFVGAYENGRVTLSFTKDCLEVTSKYATEKIQYTEAESVGDFTCDADIDTLITQFKSQLDSVFEIQYGRDGVLKIVSGDVTSVIALLED